MLWIYFDDEAQKEDLTTLKYKASIQFKLQCTDKGLPYVCLCDRVCA